MGLEGAQCIASSQPVCMAQSDSENLGGGRLLNSLGVHLPALHLMVRQGKSLPGYPAKPGMVLASVVMISISDCFTSE